MNAAQSKRGNTWARPNGELHGVICDHCGLIAEGIRRYRDALNLAKVHDRLPHEVD